MPSLVLFPADLSPPRVIPIDRRVLRLGAAHDNDVLLEGGGAEAHHAHVVYDKQTFTIAGTDSTAVVYVNGKRRRSHKLSDRDLVQLGDHVLRFAFYDHGLQAKPGDSGGGAFDRFDALHRFSSRLMATWDLDVILDALLDELIGLTGADKAFLLLTLDGRSQVYRARNIEPGSRMSTPEDAISDSIVSHVRDSGAPLIVADALSHDAFKASKSVMNLKLSSVMCVPLKARGSTLGLFYLGNDNAINHFDEQLLEVVTVLATHAGLILDNALARDELVQTLKEREEEAKSRRFGEIIGACDAMRDIYKKINRIATTDISVLIEGETGTGKELVARAIHQRSNRADKPFVVINCGAIPDSLLESELFGHVRGAFTGAVATTRGKFQAADGGTLFLDEIGEMPVALQVKILRAIQEKTVVKVGDTKAESVDIRIVAATNKRLTEEVSVGNFREDLFYRLNVITLSLPPLRERGEDVIFIARYFINRYGQEIAGHDCTLSREAVQAMKRWRWPGNIRELDNRVKKAIVFSDTGVIRPEDMDLSDQVLEPIVPLAQAREDWQRDYINHVLALNDGNRTKTARDLEVDPRTIFRHLEKERELSEA
ncbi:MAG: Fis family transcriptional regulator [Deltaproteobacteria bacterium]|nr:MAG: Fis family transcriptional regulator [Deltaproteobacteria bacterium]